MSEVQTAAPKPAPAGVSAQQSVVGFPPSRPRGPPLHKIYQLPAPIRTFPLPSFYPNNPISLFHVVYAWTKQLVFPPSAEPSVVHEGIWSPESRSVNIVDPKSMRALWEQGFYGKGNLSRSEPNWLKREQVRRGLVPGQVSELVTASRREERKQMKWERAKTEQEAIRQTRLREEQAAREAAGAAAATDAPDKSANGVIPDALVDPISLPEQLVPVDLAADVETTAAQETMSNVTTDASIITPTDAAPGTIQGAHVNGVVNGVSGVSVEHLETVTITKAAPPVAVQDNNVEAAVLALSAPTGPMQLLRLPNSRTGPGHHKDSVDGADEHMESFTPNTNGVTGPVGPLELLSLPNTSIVNGWTAHSNGLDVVASLVSSPQKLSTIHEDTQANGSANTKTGHLIKDLLDGDRIVNGVESDGTPKPVALTATDLPQTPRAMKRRKSVRFSPKVESATYQSNDPPSPSFALLNANGKAAAPPAEGFPLGSAVDAEETPAANGVTPEPAVVVEAAAEAPEAEAVEIVNKEHLQLTREEAFFLSFGLGALKIVDSTTKAAIATADLFKIFRQYSSFPSRPESELQPDDSFLVHYAVYHHFRSLGWVPRPGIKFGVDWMLYAKGPVFDHAEFGAIILPSYSNQWWKDSKRELPRKTWHWLHGVVRVLSHVQKSLVLVYVDVPPPPVFDEAMRSGGPAEVLKLYEIREVMVKRWSSNRNR
ncbi:putative tRNA-splicing endonuclease subunit tsp-2 [Colletotrichum sidae]|uniref:tRNA-intron lyase n=1 Tax=Colletotrichum sidae TaxID=1347389 RepID=A0A4R8TI37_9PEZI|nr:putative tRNA-splicing endonuclease subunit tsp-2 [Colletotrichum sidae]